MLRIPGLTLLLCCALCFLGKTQFIDLSFAFQAYPTGLISGLQIEKGFQDKNAIHFRFGYQFIRHGDLGVQEDERGDGFGGSLGYKRYFKDDFQGLFLAARSDLWWNTLDWTNDIDQPNATHGTSKIVVLQPTLQTGYLIPFGKDFFFTPTLSFGYEVNIQTKGADVGEGAIILLGFQIGKRFQ